MKCRHARTSELDGVCDLLAMEFNNDPVHKVVFSDPEGRIDFLRNYFRIYIDLASKYGGTLLAENNQGALVYLRPGAMEINDEDYAVMENKIREVSGSHYEKVAAYTRGLEHFHPRKPYHYYILLLAVQRASRGSSVVNDLFNSLHVIADREKFPCYAECTKFSTRTLLRRWHYRDAGFQLSIEGFPELFPVWREPQ
ncbi:hypothetical protein [Pantoea cypripedii]|uniref:N-acetyltransferase n=1 Tax=Pantoea cypripedii TaxID=55209 RepID=A0A1X1EX43_PANCY|nr:hypothetical protein [Pantoea cypripedii]MBP2194601.1 hypothetical protein [Pantoea cypripedii]ORM94501.1 hypothetical protein HA50_14530 [Pantoea cypripedii]